MIDLEWIRAERNRGPVLLADGAMVLAIATAEWWTKNHFSVGLFYLFPIMLAAGFLPPWAVVLQGVGCTLLSLHFTSLDPSPARIQFGVEALAFIGCGLFAGRVLHPARLSEVRQRMCALVETGPVAMVTVDVRGSIETANCAAVELLAPRDGQLIGQPIAGFLPALHYALRSEGVREFRTAVECRGHLGNGQPFLAQVWFSTYRQGATRKLAAVITDVGARPTAS